MLIDQTLTNIQKKVDSSYFVVDETQFFSSHIILELKKAFLGKETPDNFSIYHPEDFQIDDLIEDLKTVSILSSRRLMVFKEAERLTKHQMEPLVELLKWGVPDQCLVFVAKKKPRYDFLDYFKTHDRVLEFKKPYDSKMSYWVNWVVRRQKKRIDPRATMLLIERVGSDLQWLEREVEKLCLYVGDQNSIDEGSVKALLFSTRSHSIFELTAAVGYKKKEKALKILESMIQEGESEIFMFAMIVRHLRLLWQAVEWSSEKTDVQIQRALGIHPAFWDEFRRQRDVFMKSPFTRYWEKAAEVDTALKTSGMGKMAWLSEFICSIT